MSTVRRVHPNGLPHLDDAMLSPHIQKIHPSGPHLNEATDPTTGEVDFDKLVAGSDVWMSQIRSGSFGLIGVKEEAVTDTIDCQIVLRKAGAPSAVDLDAIEAGMDAWESAIRSGKYKIIKAYEFSVGDIDVLVMFRQKQ